MALMLLGSQKGQTMLSPCSFLLYKCVHGNFKIHHPILHLFHRKLPHIFHDQEADISHMYYITLTRMTHYQWNKLPCMLEPQPSVHDAHSGQHLPLPIMSSDIESKILVSLQDHVCPECGGMLHETFEVSSSVGDVPWVCFSLFWTGFSETARLRR